MRIEKNLSKRRYELSFLHRVWILWPHGPRQLANIAGRGVSISCQNTWLPHGQGCQVHVAEWTQIQVTRVTLAERVTLFLKTKKLLWFVHLNSAEVTVDK